MATAKLKKIDAGRYETPDGRYELRSAYDPSGAPHVREPRGMWLVIDRTTGKTRRVPGFDTAKLLVRVA